MPYPRSWHQPSSQLDLLFCQTRRNGKKGKATAGDRYQTPLLIPLRFSQKDYCSLGCTKNSTAWVYASPHRPACHFFTHSLPAVNVGKFRCWWKQLSWPIQCLQNRVASSQEGHLGRATNSFASFLLTQEGHRKDSLHILHGQGRAANMTGKTDHPLKQFAYLKHYNQCTEQHQGASSPEPHTHKFFNLCLRLALGQMGWMSQKAVDFLKQEAQRLLHRDIF